MKRELLLLAAVTMLFTTQAGAAGRKESAKVTEMTYEKGFSTSSGTGTPDVKTLCIDGYKFVFLRGEPADGTMARSVRPVALVQMFEKVVVNQNGKATMAASVPIPCPQQEEN